jgi:TonB family protein
MSKIKIILVIIGFIGLQGLYAQPCKKKFKDKLEPNAKLVSCNETTTFEELPDGKWLKKTYYTEDLSITELVTFESIDCKVKDGLYEERWDDGTLVKSGFFKKGLKTGEWREGSLVGHYVNGERQGRWTSVSKKSGQIETHYDYLNNVLHGNTMHYDSLNRKESVVLYNQGEIVNITEIKYDSLGTPFEETYKGVIVESMARFPGCDSLGLPELELKKCAEAKMLKFVYEMIRYPSESLKKNIQGKVVASFTIDTDGRVVDIKIINAVAKDLAQEVVRILKAMPKWVPGTQRGKAAKVSFTMPITFNLE